MCVLSMVMEYKFHEWSERYKDILSDFYKPMFPAPFSPTPGFDLPSQQEIDEFRRLLDRAKEYDKKNNQPDCSLEEKRVKFLELARQLGIPIKPEWLLETSDLTPLGIA